MLALIQGLSLSHFHVHMLAAGTRAQLHSKFLQLSLQSLELTGVFFIRKWMTCLRLILSPAPRS